MSNKLETGIQYMQEGNWEEAAKNFTEAIEENPKDALGYINFANLLDVLWFRKCILWPRAIY